MNMINIQYLEYFMVSAEVGSFSKAAEILYTTQPNISKGIKALEKTVGAPLFVRQPMGIVLTAQGKHVYKYACQILENMEALKDFSKVGAEEWVHFSANPSSWMANRFVEFYNLHYEDNIHWQIFTASVKTIMERVRDYKDEIGFVYVMESQRASFQYALARSHLEFVPLKGVEVMLFLGEKHPGFQDGNISEQEMRELRFVQSYQDEFSKNNYWSIRNEIGREVTNMDVAVITNSDYIMERMLQNTRLANISSNYLTESDGEKNFGGISLEKDKNQVVFGYLKREKEELGRWAREFAAFVERALEKGEEGKL